MGGVGGGVEGGGRAHHKLILKASKLLEIENLKINTLFLTGDIKVASFYDCPFIKL